MKYLLLFVMVIALSSSGCIFYKTATFNIRYDDNSNSGHVRVTYTGIKSTEESPEKQQKDFKELIEILQGDDLLLDELEHGIYIKERRLFKKNNELIGEYSGIFRNLEIDGKPIENKKGEHLLVLDADDDFEFSTNGKLIVSENTVVITWPKEQTELILTLSSKTEGPLYSISNLFDEWASKTNYSPATPVTR